MRDLVVAALTLQLAAGAASLAAQTPNRTAPPPSGNGEVHGTVISSAAQTVRATREGSVIGASSTSQTPLGYSFTN